MSQPLLGRINLIELYVKKGEIEKSKEQAAELIRQYPESPYGYLLMSYHYLQLQQIEEVNKWCREALQRGPEEEAILESAATIYQSINFDKETRIEIVENGLRLYPANGFFHAQYAQLNEHNTEQALASYKEAIRLNPYNAEYLADYAIYLYQLDKRKDGEQYEQLALQANPENSKNLLNFAWISYQHKKYKKAQLLIDEAMRLDPYNQTTRHYYKKIYVIKHPFIKAKKEINLFLYKCWTYPTIKIYKLFAEKVNWTLLCLIVLALELLGLSLLLGKNLFFLFGIYILLLYISHKVEKSMLKAAGLTDAEETSMKKETKVTQKAALKEMKKGLGTSSFDTRVQQEQLAANDLEEQLSKIWGSNDISQIRKQTEAKGTAVKEETPQETRNTKEKIEKEKEIKPIEWPKESNSKWPIFMMIFGIFISIMVRHVPNMIEDSNRPKPLPIEEKQAVVAFQENQKLEQDKSIVEGNMPAITQFLQALQEGNSTNTMSLFISNNYERVIQENIDHPLLNQLANAKIEKVSTILTSSYFLIVNEQENVKAVAEVQFGQMTHLYAENWSQSVEDKENYNKWLTHIEENGMEIESKEGQ
jgi:tetratricopeptide (TPR) repeat protein